MFFVLSIFEEFSYYKLETYLPVITNISRVEILEPQYFLDLIYRTMISRQRLRTGSQESKFRPLETGGFGDVSLSKGESKPGQVRAPPSEMRTTNG